MVVAVEQTMQKALAVEVVVEQAMQKALAVEVVVVAELTTQKASPVDQG